jgi:hypothetical protein
MKKKRHNSRQQAYRRRVAETEGYRAPVFPAGILLQRRKEEA